MTRINVIPPSHLSDKHLGAEYRELPRVFGLVRRAAERGEKPSDLRNPKEYVLGAGHVRFFYPRLAYISARYLILCAECSARGRKVNFGNLEELVQGIPREWFKHWTPTPTAVQLNIDRINERGGLKHVNS